MYVGIMSALGAGAFWGLAFLIPSILGHYTPMQVTLGRFFFYALASVVFLLFKSRNILSRLNKRIFSKLFVLSLIGHSLYYVILIKASRETSISMMALVMGSLPVTIALAGSRGWKELKKYIIPALMILFSLVMININVILQWNASLFTGLGIFLAIAAHILWLKFALMNSKFLDGKDHDLTAFEVSCLYGVVSFLQSIPLILIFDWNHFSFAEMRFVFTQGDFLLGVFILGAGASFIANYMWNHASQLLPMAFLGMLIVSETIFAIVYEMIWKQHWPSITTALAVLILVKAVFIASYQQETP